MLPSWPRCSPRPPPYRRPAAPPAPDVSPARPAAPAPDPDRPLTEAEYLHIERTTPDGPRCEFDGTYRLPMPGTTFLHADIAKEAEKAIDRLIAARDGGPPLMTFRTDVRLRVPSGRYRYPDVMLTTRPPQAPDDEHDIVLNPLVIVEVLFDSTEHVDRGAKLREYRGIPSLTDYVLLSQDGPVADHYTRVGGGADHPDEPDAWRVVTYEGPDAAVPLAGLGELRLGAVYEAG